MALCDGYFRRRFPDISWSIRLDGLSPQAGAQSHGRCRSRGTPGAHRCSSEGAAARRIVGRRQLFRQTYSPASGIVAVRSCHNGCMGAVGDMFPIILTAGREQPF